MNDELHGLLLEFTSTFESGKTMNPQRLEQLCQVVRTALVDEFATHGEHLLIRDRVTGRITWKPRRQLQGLRARAMLEDLMDSTEEWLDPLVATLDRMLTEGTRRNSLTRMKPKPRLAKQVADQLVRNARIEDPDLLVRDCLRHAIFDEVRSALRRRLNGGRRRVRRPPRSRKHDKRSLVRRFDATKLLAAGPDGQGAAQPDDLAYCIAFEYHRGGLDRASADPFAGLRLGDGPLAEVLDAIDRRFEQSDLELQRAEPGSTRRRPARAKGITSRDFSSILRDAGLALSQNSLSKLYDRRRKRIEEAVR